MALWYENNAKGPGSRRSAQTTGWRRHALAGTVAASVTLLAVLAIGITSALRPASEAPLGTAARPTPAPSPVRVVQPPVAASETIRTTLPAQIATGEAERRVLVVRRVPGRDTSSAPVPDIRRSSPRPPPPRAPSPAKPSTPVPIAPSSPPDPPSEPAVSAPAPDPVATSPSPPSPAPSNPPPVVVPPEPNPEVADHDADEDHDDREPGRPEHEGHHKGHQHGPDCHEQGGNR